MSARLQGKVAFITGAARGQGRAHAVRLASEGADIIALDLAGTLPDVPYDSPTLDDLGHTAKLVEAEGRQVVTIQADTRDLETMRSRLDEAVAQLGRLDVVVGNAGICVPAAWSDITPEMFGTMMDINVTGTWNTVMASAPHLITSGGGSIILTSSYAARKMTPFMVHYTASKHAVTGLTRAFAAELGQYGIRVNSIHPGAVDTPMGSEQLVAALNRATESNPNLGQIATYVEQKLADPEQIAATVAFLASDDADFITSEQVSIDGGAQHF
ncbi:MAG: mycofactocin-coupled SDR family oxidoreductase [Aeromicrobium sp.]